jgi:hypothetical protein
MSDTTATGNRLGNERSAYLRSAAHQPVAWQPWSEAAFARARQLNRPILLDIGAVWCHWCHVMDGESYENDSTASIINEHFVAIKVDRDERPEVDRRYQEAVSALTGQGGWPLTAFLTPDGQVFFGGTYFPPVDRYGRRAFSSVLLQVAEYYSTNHDSVLSMARQVADSLATHSDQAQPGTISRALLDGAFDQILKNVDPVNGGFGDAPKFPHASAVEFLLAQYFFTKDERFATVIKQTLNHMARGGVYDQIGGGFHRYSTDARWIVPHFEKMLYDNTELLRNYAAAAAAFNDPFFRETAIGIIGFLTEVLADREHGGFYSSQDADVGMHDDGDYFTWTLAEVKAVCTSDETQALAERYDISENGEMQHNPAKNVLFISEDVDVIAAKLGTSETEVKKRLGSGIAKLRAARGTRSVPFIDRSIYAAWNGMAVSAVLWAADLLDLPDARAFALRTLDRLAAECVLPDGQVRHALGQEIPTGLLEDGVFVARAFIDAFERTGEDRYLSSARRITDDLIKRLWDEAAGGFIDHAPGPEAIGLLAQPRKPIQDAPTPAPNAVIVEVLLRLSELTGDESYGAKGEKTLTAFAGATASLGVFGGSYYLALDRFLRGSAIGVVVGRPDDPKARALRDAAQKIYRPYFTLRQLDPESAATRSLPPELAAMITSGKTLAYFCAGHTCALPADDAAKYTDIVGAFGR